jgi:hypothetical protein
VEQAGLMWGALEAEEEGGTVGQWEGERELYADAVLAHAGDDFERGRAQGTGLSLDDAVRVAFGNPA